MRWDDLVIRAEWKTSILEYVKEVQPDSLK